MNGQESKKHLSLKIIRKDIVSLQPVFAWQLNLVNLNSSFAGLTGFRGQNENPSFVHGGKWNEMAFPIMLRL